MAGFVLSLKWPGPFSKNWWVSPSLRVFKSSWGRGGWVKRVPWGAGLSPTCSPLSHGWWWAAVTPTNVSSTLDSKAGLHCGCLYFRCDFRWPRVTFMYVAQEKMQLIWRQPSKALAPRRVRGLEANPAPRPPRPNPGCRTASQLVITALALCPLPCQRLPEKLRSHIWGRFLLRGACEDEQLRLKADR